MVRAKPEEHVGERIRRLRKLLGLTQEQAAVRYGVTGRTWGDWERGKHNPPDSTVELLEVHAAQASNNNNKEGSHG